MEKEGKGGVRQGWEQEWECHDPSALARAPMQQDRNRLRFFLYSFFLSFFFLCLYDISLSLL